jgi:nucleotidyltransferase/DNA polymerase involved in DNA repair
MNPNVPQGKPLKRFLSDREIEELYGIGEAKLKRMRLLGEGPEFRRFGHKTVLYDVRLLEAWIDKQPRGGERVGGR